MQGASANGCFGVVRSWEGGDTVFGINRESHFLWSPFAAFTAVMTFITLVAGTSKRILGINLGEGITMQLPRPA